MQGTDFAKAIIAHDRWKLRLGAFIRGSGEVLDPALIQQDGQCDLGKWLYGDGLAYQHEPEYKEVLAHHARFHQQAAAIVRRVKVADTVGAATLLAVGSEYSRASNSTILGLTALRRKVRRQPAH